MSVAKQSVEATGPQCSLLAVAAVQEPPANVADQPLADVALSYGRLAAIAAVRAPQSNDRTQSPKLTSPWQHQADEKARLGRCCFSLILPARRTHPPTGSTFTDAETSIGVPAPLETADRSKDRNGRRRSRSPAHSDCRHAEPCLTRKGQPCHRWRQSSASGPSHP